MTTDSSHEGGCDCGRIRYRLAKDPLIVNCCHCRWCQRESGSAFALNAVIESQYLSLTREQPESILTPSASGKGQEILRCPTCRIALWSHYGGYRSLSFIRVGSLDNPDRCPPSVHIFTSTKQPWVELSIEVPAFEEYYDRKEVWPEESLARYDALRRG